MNVLGRHRTRGLYLFGGIFGGFIMAMQWDDQVTSYNTAKKTKVVKVTLKTVQLARIEASSLGAAAQELKEKFEVMKEKKAYTTFGALKVAMGGRGNYVPSDTDKVLMMVNKAGAEYTALVVDTFGQQSAKVAVEHKATLESWGYTNFPKIAKSTKKETEQEVL